MSDGSGFTVTRLTAGVTPASAQVLMQDVTPEGLQALTAESVTWVPPEQPRLDLVPHRAGLMYPGAAGTAFAGKQYFAPEIRVAMRTPTSHVPAVYLEKQGEQWVLRLILQLFRGPDIPPDAVPLNLTTFRMALRGHMGELTLLPTIADQAPAQPDVVRQLSVSGPVDASVSDTLKSDFAAALAISCRADFDWSDAAYAAAQTDESAPLFGGPVDPSGRYVFEHDLPLLFPPSQRANRPIYALVDGAASVDAGLWSGEPTMRWRPAGAGSYWIVPDEYRLAFDPEHGLPAVTVLLLPPDQGAAPAGAAPGGVSAYRVRVRFQLVPWWDPERLGQMRTDIAESQDVPAPQLQLGGYEKVEFIPSQLFAGLGGDQLDPGTKVVDPQGFELVFDCSMEFYTLICHCLAPDSGMPDGLKGSVRFTLATGADTTTVDDVPMRIR